MIKDIIRNLVIWILTQESRLVLYKFKPKIICITGNAGKTGTKDAVAAILKSDFSVWENEKSYNSDIGIPLTILHCKNAWSNLFLWFKNIVQGLVLLLLPQSYPKWLVLEVGADKPGDISKFTKWLNPDIVIVTRIGETPVHIENFASRDDLIKEKSELVKALKHGGLLILNSDDPDVLAMKNLALGAKVITFGFSPNSNIRASNYKVTCAEVDHVSMPDGIAFKVDYLGNSIPVRIKGVIGLNNVYSLLPAFAVGSSLGINFLSMLQSAREYERPLGRLKIIEGINDSIILDDTYNSSPAAVLLAFESVKDIIVPGKKIAVIGDMLELGSLTVPAHIDIGREAVTYFDLLITVGQRAENIAKGALLAGIDPKKIITFLNSVDAGDYLAKHIKKNDLVFLKGSQGIRLERAIIKILMHPEDRERLLARQEKEWLGKPATA